MSDNYDKAGWHAALEAFMMTDPHPKGYISNSIAARLTRSLQAYEWAKKKYPMHEVEDGFWSQAMPAPGAAREAVMAMEREDD